MQLSQFGQKAVRAGSDAVRAVISRDHPNSPPRLSGALPGIGHMMEFSKNPFETLVRARAEGGDSSSDESL